MRATMEARCARDVVTTRSRSRRLLVGVIRLQQKLTLAVLSLPFCAIDPTMMDWSSSQAVERDPERYSGAWVFRGTRVPIAALFENLEDDASAHEFVEWFPGVTLEQVQAVLEHAARSGLSVA